MSENLNEVNLRLEKEAEREEQIKVLINDWAKKDAIKYMQFLIDVFNHRVDAAVAMAIDDSEKANASLAALNKVIHEWSMSVSWGSNICQNRLASFIAAYPEHMNVAQAGLEEGRQFLIQLDKEAELEEQRNNDSEWGENDDSDWGDFDSLTEEIFDGNKAYEDGVKARANGLTELANPNPPSTSLNDYWIWGWQNGKSEVSVQDQLTK